MMTYLEINPAIIAPVVEFVKNANRRVIISIISSNGIY